MNKSFAKQDTPFHLISGDTGSVDYFWHPQPVNKNSNSTVEESQKSAGTTTIVYRNQV